jgi:osmotically-inducible protein OsmY
VWVAQTGGSVVLKGKVPSQDMLNSLVAVASSVNGASGVNTDQVEIG